VHRWNGSDLDDRTFHAHRTARDPLVERVARNPQPRAQPRRTQLAALDRAVNGPRRQARALGGLGGPQEQRLVIEEEAAMYPSRTFLQGGSEALNAKAPQRPSGRSRTRTWDLFLIREAL
jgi:hypothetical protein